MANEDSLFAMTKIEFREGNRNTKDLCYDEKIDGNFGTRNTCFNDCKIRSKAVTHSVLKRTMIIVIMILMCQNLILYSIIAISLEKEIRNYPQNMDNTVVQVDLVQVQVGININPFHMK